MEEVKLPVGTGWDAWDFEEVVFTGVLVEQRGDRALYRDDRNRYVMHITDEGLDQSTIRSLQLVSKSGRRQVTLNEALGLAES